MTTEQLEAEVSRLREGFLNIESLCSIKNSDETQFRRRVAEVTSDALRPPTRKVRIARCNVEIELATGSELPLYTIFPNDWAITEEDRPL